MSKKYKVVVVGLGKRGKHHATTFHNSDRFEVVGIGGRDRSRLEPLAAELGYPEINTDVPALVSSLKPDVFCFCTPPNVRSEMIKIGVQCGAKLIAFEKPIALSSAEAMEIKRMLENNGIKAVVSHQHRYGDHYQKVKDILSGGSLGRVHTVYGTAVGWMMHLLTHLIDYMRWYNDNAEAEWVIGQAAGRGKLTDAHASPDYISGFIHFANGVHGIVECGAGAPDVPEVDYWWRKCRIGAQGTEGFAEVLTGGGWRAVTKDGVFSGEGCMDYEHDMPPYIQEMADWLDDDQKVHPCNFDSAYKGFEIMMALCRSVVEGGQVALPLPSGDDELKALRDSLPDKELILSIPQSEKEYR
ncbi:Gfo/Idh/MocA family oxidoreductase [Acidobacteria bacterium AH-259-A15]|nr:Gfo/Idh/MocA family oxidoreductase [Acidobacteria bacterium AH-259-A15]